MPGPHLPGGQLGGRHGQRRLGHPSVLALQQPQDQVVRVAPHRAEQRDDRRDQLDVGVGQPAADRPQHRALGRGVLEQGQRRLEPEVVGGAGAAGELAHEAARHRVGVLGAEEEAVVPGEGEGETQPPASVQGAVSEGVVEQRLHLLVRYAVGRTTGRAGQGPDRGQQPPRGQAQQPLVPEGDLDRRPLPAALPAADPAGVGDQGSTGVVGHGLQAQTQLGAGQPGDGPVGQVQPARPGGGVDDLRVPGGPVLRHAGGTTRPGRIARSGVTTHAASRGH